MHPPHKTLKWDKIVEYAFLANFDLLCNMRADVSQQPWASPVARRAMDLYFKMCQAWEEIQYLNVEVRHLVTYIRDKDKYLRAFEDQLKAVSPTLTHQQLHEISTLPGFTGTISPGISTHTGLGESSSTPNAQIPSQLAIAVALDTPDDLDEEEQEEEVEEEASRSLQDVLHVADDLS
ncbi:uncharacterized protein F5891DRAFT_1188843 [Suillus fuscotomentosus]|uniref:Uncharacterized protein n=1 Tax=Suillus fuscotomentosus TaxID=1912939 RepID=A0AAD4E6F3_9AGAM|nr:uncharacterized protein F5891DRAFT_1188843 [Suillus fuscotomentosus]KAG1900151.1 hypothetical protein F5891DRAFT_1188843 [Suillus fuscotomentosus]